MKSNNKYLILPYLSYLSSIKKSKKPTAYSFKPIDFLGRLKKIKLPISYLSYLFRLGRLVSSGKFQVTTQSPIITGFGRLGKFFIEKQFKKNIITFSILFLFLSIVSCGTQMHSERNKNAIAGQQEDNIQNYMLENAEFLQDKEDLEKNENTE